MAKWNVRVKVMAEVEYEAEVETGSNSETEADRAAFALWREKLPEDFQVNKGYITEINVEETEQITATCERCDVDYPVNQPGPQPLNVPQAWAEDGDYCAKCGLEIEAEEAAEEAARARRRLYAAIIAAGKQVIQ